MGRTLRPMLDACSNDRDRALIAVARDSGARSGEVRSLEIGNVADHKYGLQMTVDGKQGKRTVTLVPSVPFPKDWLRNHPASNGGPDGRARVSHSRWGDRLGARTSTDGCR